MIDLNGKNSCRIHMHKGEWQRKIRCNIVMNSIAMLLLIVIPISANAAEQSSSSGKNNPCLPPQHLSAMDTRSDTPKVSSGTQRNAGNPSLSYAMALSMALGLRSVAGPVQHSKANTVAKTGNNGIPVATQMPKADRYALSSRSEKQCLDRISMR